MSSTKRFQYITDVGSRQQEKVIDKKCGKDYNLIISRKAGISMKITNIKTYMARFGGRSRGLIKVETDEGLYGWGESYSVGPNLAAEPHCGLYL